MMRLVCCFCCAICAGVSGDEDVDAALESGDRAIARVMATLEAAADLAAPRTAAAGGGGGMVILCL